MLPRVRQAIRTLQGVDWVTVPKTETRIHKPRLTAVQKRQLARLDELERLECDWDDEGAPPMEPKATANVRSLIMTKGGALLSDWVIFPALNGTYQLQAKHREAVISVGNEDYSYVFHTSNRDEMVSNEKLNINTLGQLIERINA